MSGGFRAGRFQVGVTGPDSPSRVVVCSQRSVPGRADRGEPVLRVPGVTPGVWRAGQPGLLPQDDTAGLVVSWRTAPARLMRVPSYVRAPLASGPGGGRQRLSARARSDPPRAHRGEHAWQRPSGCPGGPRGFPPWGDSAAAALTSAVVPVCAVATLHSPSARSNAGVCPSWRDNRPPGQGRPVSRARAGGPRPGSGRGAGSEGYGQRAGAECPFGPLPLIVFGQGVDSASVGGAVDIVDPATGPIVFRLLPPPPTCASARWADRARRLPGMAGSDHLCDSESAIRAGGAAGSQGRNPTTTGPGECRGYRA
ncbi:hypothetical protein T45_05465 [Streptomyces turgidiscabies]|nr:hypothetical protein T45_05465 [Streptomyces turgidiscabies]